MSINKGMFNFQGVMDTFYNYQPKEDDSEGRAMKNSFMANMVQSGFDASLAKDMAYTQSGLAKDQMTHSADLELRNKTALMNDEFNKGMMSMGGQFEFQNRFAEDQNVRDITRDTTNTATQFEFSNKLAENQNVRDITKDSYSKAADFDFADKLADNQNIRDMAKMGFQGDDYRKTLAAQGAQSRLDTITRGEQERYGMMQQGEENRLGMMQAGDESRRTETNRAIEQRLTDTNVAREGRKTERQRENRQSALSKTMARSF